MPFEKRNATRVDIWLDVFAQVEFKDALISGKVKNLGSRGMFLLTKEQLPISTKVNALLIFKLKNSQDLYLKANGSVAWYNEEGMGIQFDNIDINKFRECVVAMVNEN